MARNPNLRELIRVVKELGGEITGTKNSAKHLLVDLKTARGKTIRMTLSKSPMRAGHVEFWIRAKFQKANRNNKRGTKR